MSELVLFEMIKGTNGNIGHIILNKPKALNAINIEMIDAIEAALDECEKNIEIKCVFISGNGGKAFCAGGDVVGLYNSMQETKPNEIPETAAKFFTKEYKMDYRLHSFPKPIIAWGDGIVMGGGIGIMSACSHRITTEKSMLAMPEVTIGLYPDVAASWFFNRMPGNLGLFLGLTGARMNGADAIFCKLADYFLASEQQEILLTELKQSSWKNPNEEIDVIIKKLENLTAVDEPASNLIENFDEINWLMDGYDIEEIVENFIPYESESIWLNKSKRGFLAGCPVTYRLVFEQIKRAKYLNLKQVFDMELIISTRCAMNSDLGEGIRALLIDKDGKPNWSVSSVNEITDKKIEEYFTAPWDGKHPLVNC